MYSNKKVLVIDTGGMAALHAERIARDVGKCWYWNYTLKDFPIIEDYAKGYGLKNVEKVMRPFKYLNQADLVYFPGVGWGDLADYLRTEGHLVFGAGEAGEDLELNRMYSKIKQEKMGMPVSYSEQINGVTKLKKYMDKNNNFYVKPNIFRGNRESSKVLTDRHKESLLRKLEGRLGPMRDDVEFICEDRIENAIVETGMDLLFNGTKAIKPFSLGIEKDGPYILHYRDDLPEPINTSMLKTSKILKELNYRGAYSDEEMITSKKGIHVSYVIDMTARYAQPLSSIFTETWKNYTEVIFKVADGKDVYIDVIAPYAGCLTLSSDEAIIDWVPLDITEKNEKNVKIIYGCKTKYGVYAVKGFSVAANIIAWGKTVDSVVNQLKGFVSEMDTQDLKVETSRLDEIVSDINKMNQNGIKF